MGTVHTAKVKCPNGQVVLVAALIMLRGALALELRGLGRRGESAYAQTKRLLCIKGSKQKVYDILTETLIENNIIQRDEEKEN
jgi:hypothetical protein